MKDGRTDQMTWVGARDTCVSKNISKLRKTFLSPVCLAEELSFFGHVLLDLGPVDVAKKRADVGRAEHCTKIRLAPST